MPKAPAATPAVPRIESIQVKRYRALRDLKLDKLTPLTVILGPNGSGKSTLFDVFAFLAECFSDGLRKAWDRRGRFKELRTRGENGTIEIEIRYREEPKATPLIYHLEIGEDAKGPFVAKEWLQYTPSNAAEMPYRVLDFTDGKGHVISDPLPGEGDVRVQEELASHEYLALNTLGQLARNPRIAALRRFIADWYLCYFTADSVRGLPETGPQERLSPNGDNLPNVVQYLKEQHPERLHEILERLTRRVPRLERVDAEVTPDGRLLLEIKDAPFAQPILAKFASDGTLKMLAYLVLLFDPEPPQLIGLEEPENYLHPRLLPELAEECREASGRAQLLVSSHSPFFVNALQPEEVWTLYRNEKGFTQARRSADMKGIRELVAEGGQLGDLWMEGHFDAGDPITAGGGRKTGRSGH